jgi:hypothetical protein
MPYIIKVSRDFAVGMTFTSPEDAFRAARHMGLVNYSVIYEPAYLIVGDNGETIMRLGTNLGTATDTFKNFCNNDTYAMTLQDDNGNVLLYWNGGMGSPEFEFIDPMEPDEGDWSREQKRHDDYYWNVERRNEGAPDY